MTTKSTGWTPEKRAQAAKRMKQQKPWLKTKGPTSAEGKKVASQNAYKHGFRSEDYKSLCALLRAQKEFVQTILKNASPP